MGELKITNEPVAELRHGVCLRLEGVIDAKTVEQFQEALNKTRQEGKVHCILDLEQIRYVNSTGLGALVNIADSFEAQGGGIALIKIHPKVKVVFDMLGLNTFFRICGNLKEALSAFSAGATPLKAPAATGTKTTSLPVSTGKSLAVACKSCQVNLSVKGAGSYKCPRCSNFFKVDLEGNVRFFERKKAPPIQMKLTTTEECVEGLSDFVVSIARRIGFSDMTLGNLKLSISEISSAIVELAYHNEQHLNYNVMIIPSSTDLKIQFADYGQPFGKNIEQRLRHSRNVLDDIEIKRHPKGGNVIKIVKKL